MNSEIDTNEVEKFPLWLEEKCIADELVKCARLLLQRADLTAKQVRDIGALILAAQALPLPTKGIDIELTIKFYSDDGSTRHQSLHLSDEVFNLDVGGYSVSDCGGDSYGDDVLDMEIGGYRHEEAPAWMAVSGWLEQFKDSALDLNYELDISADGLSTLDWEFEPDESAWDNVESYESNG